MGLNWIRKVTEAPSRCTLLKQNILARGAISHIKPKQSIYIYIYIYIYIFEGSLEVKLPTIWTGTDEKQSREEAERRER
jgi:hypothetical protein